MRRCDDAEDSVQQWCSPTIKMVCGVIHVAMKRMPHIFTEGNAQVFKLQLPWFKTVRLILCALNAKSRALSAIRFIREIAKFNFVGSAQYFTQE